MLLVDFCSDRHQNLKMHLPLNSLYLMHQLSSPNNKLNFWQLVLCCWFHPGCQLLNVCSFLIDGAQNTVSWERNSKFFVSVYRLRLSLNFLGILLGYVLTQTIGLIHHCSGGQLIPTSRQLCFRSVKAQPSTTRTSGDVGTLQ